jgi:FtsP/CotA-like multicopper oxidase with cupredoxin domain
LNAIPYRQYESNYTIPQPTYNLKLVVALSPNDAGNQTATFNDHPFPDTPGKGFLSYPPVAYQYITGTVNQQFDYTAKTNADNTFTVPFGAVVEVTIVNDDGGEHPFHIHGHNFWVIMSSDNPAVEHERANNYVVRDTVSVPAAETDKQTKEVKTSGMAKFRFIASNPGAWVFHCHIEWHIDAGLVALMMEAPDRIKQNTITTDSLQVCSSYAAISATSKHV